MEKSIINFHFDYGNPSLMEKNILNFHFDYWIISLSSIGPFFIYLEYLHVEKRSSRLKFPSEIFGCGENERQSSEILNDISHIALFP